LPTDTLNFSGTISGSLSASHSNITNTFTGPTSQTTVLGGNTYAVTIGPFSPPGPPSSTNVGSISAFVAVTAPSGGNPGGNPPPPDSEHPDPPTALLARLGVSFRGLASWRHRTNGHPIAWPGRARHRRRSSPDSG